MTLRLVTPAPIDEAIALYLDTSPAKPITFKVAMVQLARSRTDAFYDGAGELVAVACYYPLAPVNAGEKHFELAFVCHPTFRRHLVAFIHLAHLTRSRLAQDGPVRVRALVRLGHLPGRRLAALCGLHLVETKVGFERWEFEGRPNDKIRRRHQVAVLGAGHVGAAEADRGAA